MSPIANAGATSSDVDAERYQEGSKSGGTAIFLLCLIVKILAPPQPLFKYSHLIHSIHSSNSLKLLSYSIALYIALQTYTITTSLLTSSMALKTLTSTPILLLLLLGFSAASTPRPRPQPCKQMVLYFHDILYNGHNSHNATSAIVGSPAWGDRVTLAGQNHFGNFVVFDDPITLDNNLHSPAVGRAQGFYLYDKKEIFTAWVGFSFVFNSTQHKGSINFAGADPLMNKTREISVIGGTGDFFMTRGVATLMTDAFEGEVYFRLLVDIKL